MGIDRRIGPDKLVRVLYFTRDYTPHDHRFLTSLSESGQEVYSLRLERAGRQLEDRSLPPGVHQLNWSGGQKPFQWRDLPRLLTELRQILRQVKPDIFHAGPIQTVAFLAALSGYRPLVTMSWGSDLLKDADRSDLYRWITRYVLRQSTVLVGDCDAVREKAAYFGFPRERSFIFPWGIDLARFRPASFGEPEESPPGAKDLRSRLQWQNQFVILSLRSWEPIYGVDVMLRGFALAARQAPELRLLMLGGGSQAAMVHQIIQQNDLGERVYLGGQVNQNELPLMYQAADLYLSASHSDGSSVSLMEALGSGLPVLLSDIPTNREWIIEGEHGWLFPDGNEQALAAGLMKLLECAQGQPEQFQAMGRAARALAEQRADWQKNFQVLLQGYRAAAGLAGRETGNPSES
jgi:L-malate glycosyltransferase